MLGCAAISIEVRYGSVGMVRLDSLFESLEARGPKLGEKRSERVESFRVDQVQAPLPVLTHGNKPSLAEHLQMKRYSLLGDVEVVGDLVDRARLVANQSNDLAPVRFGKGFQHRICSHTPIVLDQDQLYKP